MAMTTGPHTDDLPSLRQTLEALQWQHAALDAEEQALEAKIEKKKVELEHNDTRLKSLQIVRPALMEEYAKLEEELGVQYEIYVQRFRNVDYLEQELDRLQQVEQAKQARADRQLRRMQQRLQAEEERRLEGGGGGGKKDKDYGKQSTTGRSGNKPLTAATTTASNQNSNNVGRSVSLRPHQHQPPLPQPLASSHVHASLPLGGSRKASTTSTILDMGVKGGSSSSSSLNRDDDVEEEELDNDEGSLLPAEEDEEDSPGRDVEENLHAAVDDDF